MDKNYIQNCLNILREKEEKAKIELVRKYPYTENVVEETWMEIMYHPGSYISSYGRSAHTERDGTITITTHNQKRNRSNIVLSRKGKGYSINVLVAKHFRAVGKGDKVIHINGDKEDNRIDNLMFCTKSESSRHHHTTRLDTDFVPIIQFGLNGDLIRYWDNGGIAAKELNLRRGDILTCCEGETMTDSNFIWTFNNNKVDRGCKIFLADRLKAIEPFIITIEGKKYATIRQASLSTGISELDIMKNCLEGKFKHASAREGKLWIS